MSQRTEFLILDAFEGKHYDINHLIDYREGKPNFLELSQVRAFKK